MTHPSRTEALEAELREIAEWARLGDAHQCGIHARAALALPPEPEAAPRQAPEREPMTERDHFDFALWQKRLLELADKYHEANPGPAGHRARVELALHAADCATGWRSRSYLAARPTPN